MIINNKLYDALKWATLIFIPALNTATFSFLQLWGADPGLTSKVVGSIGIVNTLLGVAIGVVKQSYNKSDEKYDGTISPELAQMQTSDLALNLGPIPKDLEGRKDILLKVDSTNTPPIVEH